MSNNYSFIGPDVFMDERGNLYKKASEGFVPVKDKYVNAEDRYVEKHLQKKGREK
jgi:hypothetical protein